MKLYHYTSINNFKFILDEGILPRKLTNKQSNFKITGINSNVNCVYLTDLNIKNWISNNFFDCIITEGNTKSFKKSDIVVKFIIDLNDLDESNLRADENLIFKEKDIKFKERDLIDETVKNIINDTRWKESLSSVNACAYIGKVNFNSYELIGYGEKDEALCSR